GNQAGGEEAVTGGRAEERGKPSGARPTTRGRGGSLLARPADLAVVPLVGLANRHVPHPPRRSVDVPAARLRAGVAPRHPPSPPGPGSIPSASGRAAGSRGDRWSEPVTPGRPGGGSVRHARARPGRPPRRWGRRRR